MAKIKYVYMIFIGIAVSLWGCSDDSGEKITAVKVQVERIKPTNAGQELAYSGTIEESETIPLSFSSVGTVSKVYVSEGEFVKKGQLLVSLNNSTFKNSYELMQASERQAEDAYNRLTPMHKNGNIPDIKYVEVETGLQKAKASAAIARKNFEDCNLYAPADGYIGKRSIEPGMTAMPNLASITIVKISKVFARVSVSENEIAMIKKGQKASITIGALGSTQYNGIVEEIGVVADPIVHTYRIKIGISNKNLSIKPGMICSAAIEHLDSVNGVVVPGKAVMIDESGKNFVYIVSAQNTAIRRYIQIRRLLNSGIEVPQGLQIDETVVVAGQHKLIDNASVEIAN